MNKKDWKHLLFEEVFMKDLEKIAETSKNQKEFNKRVKNYLNKLK